jgi:uncharacterized protein (DUF1697 family)
VTRYVALLRGINVGPTTRVPMPELRAMLEAMGGAAVRTHLQSGNALFDHPAAPPQRLAADLVQRIVDGLGLTIPCIVREASDLRRVIGQNPFDLTDIDPAGFLVTFLSGPVDPEKVKGLDPVTFTPDGFQPGEREIYVHCPGGVNKTKLSHAFWEKRLGLTATARNWNTVTKLAALAEA